MVDQVPRDKIPYRIDWGQYHRDSIQLANLLMLKAMENGKMWRVIIGISTGGLFPAGIVARELGIKFIGVLGISSYPTYGEQSELKLLQRVSPEVLEQCGPGGEGAVIVDDLVDSGKTIIEAQRLYPKAHTAAVYGKKMGILYADTCFVQLPQNSWVFFPGDTTQGTLEHRPPLIEQFMPGGMGAILEHPREPGVKRAG